MFGVCMCPCSVSVLLCWGYVVLPYIKLNVKIEEQADNHQSHVMQYTNLPIGQDHPHFQLSYWLLYLLPQYNDRHDIMQGQQSLTHYCTVVTVLLLAHSPSHSLPMESECDFISLQNLVTNTHAQIHTSQSRQSGRIIRSELPICFGGISAYRLPTQPG